MHFKVQKKQKDFKSKQRFNLRRTIDLFTTDQDDDFDLRKRQEPGKSSGKITVLM